MGVGEKSANERDLLTSFARKWSEGSGIEEEMQLGVQFTAGQSYDIICKLGVTR